MAGIPGKRWFMSGSSGPNAVALPAITPHPLRHAFIIASCWDPLRDVQRDCLTRGPAYHDAPERARGIGTSLDWAATSPSRRPLSVTRR
jgi:hypothetical protein